MATETESQEAFRRLKTICVPLMGASLLSPSSIPNVSSLLTELVNILRYLRSSKHTLTDSLISYTFFPLSTILRRNSSSEIPDQLLEKMFIVLGILCEDWWWNCELAMWEQIFMLCGAVIGGIEGKCKGKDRDEETKEAAARCLLALLRPRGLNGMPSRFDTRPNDTRMRLEELIAYSQRDIFVPILGQTLDSLLIIADSCRLSLQQLSLELLLLFFDVYAPDYLIPSVLPGVMSTMTRISLGTSQSKGWANGEIVAGALKVIQVVVVKSVGDDICIKEGAVHPIKDIEDLALGTTELEVQTPYMEPRPYATLRTSLWLGGTSSQLLITMNTLTPLVSHPTPSALLALSNFSLTILAATSVTLPQIQALLLSFLLSLSISDFPSVSNEAHDSLVKLLTPPSTARHPLLQTLLHTTRDNLQALPFLLPAHADTKVQHVSGMIEAVCRLATTEHNPISELVSIGTGIGKLLGPTGGIEKWGWSLLSVLELVEPSVTITRTSPARLAFENDPNSSHLLPFPDITFRNIASITTRDALERMFRALGHAGGDSCLFAVEWFANAGRHGASSRSVTAIWCACRLLEGIGDISLTGIHDNSIIHRRSNRMEKLARLLARNIAEQWDEASNKDVTSIPFDAKQEANDANPIIQHVKGIHRVHENLHITRRFSATENISTTQLPLHRALLLQLLAVTAGILQARFTSLFIHTLYPVLHSLVSSMAHLSATALATLNFISIVTSYASPANLLLSNFDYALDSVSRRLSHRWLDIDATKVLSVMVRLVGSDVVERASDVVEECFDRLDEFHGYEIIVEGLVEVLGEVIRIIETDTKVNQPDARDPATSPQIDSRGDLDGFFEWLSHRHDQLNENQNDSGFDPAPRETWRENKINDGDEEAIAHGPDPDSDPPPTPIQALTKQIICRSLYFLTHGSPAIRARILSLLNASIPVLPESALLPSIHSAWPFILNRFADSESFVISAAASLVENLATRVGGFMFGKIWDDVWPRFRTLLGKLEASDMTNALARRGLGAVGTTSAYTYSHRLYRSLIKTMTAAMNGVHPHDTAVWEVILAFRRFLHEEVHDELQSCARDLYLAIGVNNADALWLALSSTSSDAFQIMHFLRTPRWEIDSNMNTVFQTLGM